MAVNIRQLFPIQQAKARRGQLARYLELDGGRTLIVAAVIFALLSLISLGQTGRLATQGYELANLQRTRTEPLREHGALQLQLSEAQSLPAIEGRAKALNMQPMQPEQLRYITVSPPEAAGSTPQETLP